MQFIKDVVSPLSEIEKGLGRKKSVYTVYPDRRIDNEYQYVLTKEEIEKEFDEDIYQEVINSTAFKRLENIHFLGAIDYLYEEDSKSKIKRHNRYQHSIGVARLAKYYAQKRKLNLKQTRIYIISGLLHDIGHAPLSHSLESVFRDRFGITHHKSSENIILGNVPIGEGLHGVLLKYGINPFDIASMISGRGLYDEVFNHSINIDTIEGILRANTYIHDQEIHSTPFRVLESLLQVSSYGYTKGAKYYIDPIGVLDNFWKLKNEVYNKFINSKRGVMADYASQLYMRKNVGGFDESHYYSTESELGDAHPCLFSDLKKIWTSEGDYIFDENEITYKKRTFEVNEEVHVGSALDIDRRYTQSKAEAHIKLDNRGGNDRPKYEWLSENRKLFE